METIEKNAGEGLDKLKAELKEKEEMIQLLRDAVQLRNQKIEKLEGIVNSEKVKAGL